MAFAAALSSACTPGRSWHAPEAASSPPTREFLYAANRSTSTVASFAINMASGGLTAVEGAPPDGRLFPHKSRANAPAKIPVRRKQPRIWSVEVRLDFCVQDRPPARERCPQSRARHSPQARSLTRWLRILLAGSYTSRIRIPTSWVRKRKEPFQHSQSTKIREI